MTHVEGEKVGNTVNGHGRDESRVVGILATYLMGEDEPLPLGEDGGRVRKDREKDLYAGEFSKLPGSWVRPRPFTAMGLLATTHSS